MNIFEAIIDNNVERVKDLLSSKEASPNDLEPEFFIGLEDNPIPRKKRKTAIQLAASLRRNEIVNAMILTAI